MAARDHPVLPTTSHDGKLAGQAHRHDGIAAVVTFVATLSFVPHLDNGILEGAALAVVLYLYRTMRHRVAVLGRHADGTLRGARLFNLPTSDKLIAIRFDGSLFFANVPYFEDVIHWNRQHSTHRRATSWWSATRSTNSTPRARK